MVNADLLDGPGYEGYVFINWMYPGERKFTAVKDVRNIERRIKTEGLKGWLCSSEHGHTILHNVLRKMDAKVYAADDHDLHFRKEVM